mmetsp:Transcript_17909/g.36009  ORF Transcript_17909/g.36009 Transcript_17909/m.36009 type:complete len:481 (+) Transcript_17909:395-1837(+)
MLEGSCGGAAEAARRHRSPPQEAARLPSPPEGDVRVSLPMTGTPTAHPPTLLSPPNECVCTAPFTHHLRAAARPCPNVQLGIPTVSSDGEPLLLTLPIHTPVRSRGASRVTPVHALSASRVTPVHPTGASRPPAAAAPSPSPLSNNLFDVLDREDDGAQYDREHACRWTADELQVSHEAWCHPGHSKFDSIITQYPHLFPKDKHFRATARKHRCPVCALMKGARHYRKSKRMKQKIERDHARKHAAQHAAAASASCPPTHPAAEPAAAVALHGQASICTAHEIHKRVRFTADTVDHCKLPRDDFLHAFKTSTPLSRLSCFHAYHDLHVDYAHSISLGYRNEAYYLVMVVDGVDFLWAAPTAHKSNPEALLESFLATPTVWMWSFRLKKPIRLHDPVFYDDKKPFLDPSCLVNREDLWRMMTRRATRRRHAPPLLNLGMRLFGAVNPLRHPGLRPFDPTLSCESAAAWGGSPPFTCSNPSI